MSVVLSCLCHVCLVVLLEMLIEESRALGEGGGRRASHVSIKRNNVSVYPRNGLGREKKEKQKREKNLALARHDNV